MSYYRTTVREHLRRTSSGRFTSVRHHQRRLTIIKKYGLYEVRDADGTVLGAISGAKSLADARSVALRTFRQNGEDTRRGFRKTGRPSSKAGRIHKRRKDSDDFAVVERAAREDAAKVGAWAKKEGAAAKAWWARHKEKKRLQAEQARREKTFGQNVGKRVEKKKEEPGEGLMG